MITPSALFGLWTAFPGFLLGITFHRDEFEGLKWYFPPFSFNLKLLLEQLTSFSSLLLPCWPKPGITNIKRYLKD